jgi:ABC-type oligopeptide transport system substrate-binding subunit
MSKVVRVALLSIMIAGLLAGFAGAADLAKEQALNIAFDAGDLKSLDPQKAAATADRAIVDMMFNGLVRYPPGNQVNVPRQEGLDVQAAQGGLLPSLSGKPQRL